MREEGPYKSIIPATDWYFVDKPKSGEQVVWRIAAWALTNSGEVIGLLGGTGATADADGIPRLVAVPPVNGLYLHKEQLSPEEREKTARR